ncbi:alpha/beta fold hydrolase [Homoserinibacter sp. YIM 151385]|uniref:alpha/beta fold hydrolase n=1 Tax=Homoserinibacter sp. YIM 151385 TaxID=2985506 RepID=UPI0022F00465|nr:alpha/beta hydrolase [Homoserinibacter sp. YIM 151385]WBU37954.1 alpha/beta hydrolase [Homoserinibacter sp. YIM 151385]
MTWLDRLRLRRRPPRLHVAIDEGSGPVVILVHGIASSSTTFEKLVPLLVGRHRVIAIDLLGFGESPAAPDGRYTIEEHVASLERTIRGLRIRGPITLVGHSMGALFAARYAASRPSRIRHLVLIAPPVYLAPSEVGDPVERAAMGLYLKAYEYLRGNKAFTIRNAALLARMSPIRHVLEVSERNWDAFVRSLENSIESQTAISDIAAVRAPIDLVAGTLDPFLQPTGLRIVEQMRHVTSHRVEGNDHLVRSRVARVVRAAIESRELGGDRARA